MHRQVIVALLSVLAGAVLVVAAMRLLEPRMIYFPGPAPALTPAAAGLAFEEAAFPTADGETLRGWWIPAADPRAPVVLFFHGNAGTREHRIEILQGFHRAGLGVFIFDYRGYGGSTGRPSEAGLLLDGEAAFDWLRGNTGDAPIVFYGHSLGGAVAAVTALRRPAAGLILESVFTSVPDMAIRVVPLPFVRYVVKTRFDTRAALGALTQPLLLIHGDADEVVPFSMGRRLFEASAAPDKTFRAVPGSGHNDVFVVGGEEYWGWISEFAWQRIPREN